METKDDTPKDTSTAAAEPAERDVVLLHSRTEDGQGIRALRARERQLELAEIRPLKQGQPLGSGEVVRLRPRGKTPLVCDVDVLYKSDEQADGAAGHAGPPVVASARYRRNWDTIFGDPGQDTDLN